MFNNFNDTNANKTKNVKETAQVNEFGQAKNEASAVNGEPKLLTLPLLPMSLSGVSAAIMDTNTSQRNPMTSLSSQDATKLTYSTLNNVDINASYDLNQQKMQHLKKNFNNNHAIGLAMSKQPLTSNLHSNSNTNLIHQNSNFNDNVKANFTEEIFEINQPTTKPRLLLSAAATNNVSQTNSSKFTNLPPRPPLVLKENSSFKLTNNNKNNITNTPASNTIISTTTTTINNKIMATLPGAPIILNTKSLIVEKVPLTTKYKSSSPIDSKPEIEMPIQQKMLEENSVIKKNSISSNLSSSTLILNANINIKPPSSNSNTKPLINMNLPQSLNDSLTTLNLYQSSYSLISEENLATDSCMAKYAQPANALSNPSSNSLAISGLNEKEDEAVTMATISKEDKAKLLKEFDLLNTIGTGTFGRVILVKHQTTKQYFALKMMSIHDVIRLKQIEHVKNEKNILEITKNHPFIVKLFWTHHDIQYLYMMLEYVPGGELFTLLRQRNKFETKIAIFYAAEIVCALEYLHSMQIAYRDLKPENILLDIEGHLKLTDFGFAKVVSNKTYTLCGTPEYLAPEVILNRGHDMCCDWWTLGIIIFEFLSGSPPFYDENQYKVYEKILGGSSKIEWPRHFDSTARDIIKKLLVSDPSKRLGSGNCGIVNSMQAFSYQTTPLKNEQSSSDIVSPLFENDSIFLTQNENPVIEKDFVESKKQSEKPNLSELSSMSLIRKKMLMPSIINHMRKQKSSIGAEEIKKHRWFVSISSWSDVYERRLKPPFKPEISHDGDTRNFEKYETPDLFKVPVANDKQMDFFVNF